MKRNYRLTRRSASRTLAPRDGAGTHRVERLIAAATAPAYDWELAGEERAIAMFRAATLESTIPDRRRPSMIKTAIANMVAAKVLTATAVAAAATGGLALAAATGNLPNPLGSSQPSGAPAGGTSATAAASSGSPETANATAHPSAQPTPSLRGLCHAYQAGATSNQGKALQSPAFAALVAAADGEENVDAYCTALNGAPKSHPTGAPTSHPTGAPTSHPTGAPTSHPTGAPTSHPTEAPTSHPTEAPTSHPTEAPTSHPTGAPASHPTGR